MDTYKGLYNLNNIKESGVIMDVKTMKDVSKRCRDIYQRGDKALKQRNYSFAIEMMREALKIEPAFNEARTKLRQAQLVATNGGQIGGLQKISAQISAMFSIGMKGPKLLKDGNFKDALDMAEAAMTKNPTDLTTLNFLAKASHAASLLEVELDALKLIRKQFPKNIPNLKALANCYKANHMADEMVEAFQAICTLKPEDSTAVNDMKAATAHAAMNRGNWETAGSFRDIIADKDKAKEMEQMDMGQARDADTLAAMIVSTEKNMAEQENIQGRKRLAELYYQAENWVLALENYERIVELSGTAEPAIAAAIVEVKVAEMDRRITDAGDDADKVAALETEKELSLYNHAESMVKRFPNDPAYRFDFGQALFNRGDYTKALAELQQSQRNPRFKATAGRLMGRSFFERGQIDMAIDQFKTVLEDLKVMNDDKKETLYYLGLALESQGKGEEAVEVFKQIFQADVAFRDVDARINSFYQNK